MKDDERKVVELIINSGGSMLQSDIARQSGFSRVKTHRILYRLSTRGIIVAEKHYNTYKITLAEWLFPRKKQPSFIAFSYILVRSADAVFFVFRLSKDSICDQKGSEVRLVSWKAA